MMTTIASQFGSIRVRPGQSHDASSAESKGILTSDALEFIAKLSGEFDQRRVQLLGERERRQRKLDRSPELDFLKSTEEIRSSEWRVAPAPKDLLDRRVEITGPSGDSKMMINAFNSGASTYMADFEDAQSPTWEATMDGQINLRDAIRREISFESTEGKRYSLNEGRIATLIVRPRGWHLDEKHIEISGTPISASLFDFGLFLYTNADQLRANGSGPYFYLPKIESHLEARLWNEVLDFAEQELGLARGIIRATVLIETITAAFEMDEILYELRKHSTGLNCGRWDYIFSFIKKFRNHPEFLTPDRAEVTMDRGFLRSYVDLLVRTCHRRGAHAIGGMSAYIPVKGDEQKNRAAFRKVKEDKLREVRAGHDGTWVAHPGLVHVAKEVFDEHMKGLNQISNVRNGIQEITASDLLAVPTGNITEEGLTTNIGVAIRYIASWLGGRGAVPINNMMEDTATAEICRAQVWQWLRHGARMRDGRAVDLGLVRHVAMQELSELYKTLGPELFGFGNFELAATLFDRLVSAHFFSEFLTTPAYIHLLSIEKMNNFRG
ncbi:MAG TPA: malate synthase A [Nitrososphaerales archaeon]|nr:malate synthase A [Nitrososphaerales archaeon]